MSFSESCGIRSTIPFLSISRCMCGVFIMQYRAEPGSLDLDYVLREIYVLYTDCALKDPFYELEMPIRCELFTNAVDALIQKVDKSSKGR